MEKLKENTKNNEKEIFNGTPKTHHCGVLPKGSTKLKKSFGRNI
jgi:hypothetical protein